MERIVPFRPFDAVIVRPVDSIGDDKELLPRRVECGEKERLLFLSSLRPSLVVIIVVVVVVVGVIVPQNLPFNPVSFDGAEEDRLRRRLISALIPTLLLMEEDGKRRVFNGDGEVEWRAAG